MMPIQINSEPVLVLNHNYEPLNICRAQRALILLFKGKAELIKNGRGVIRTATDSYPMPSVIKLLCYVRRSASEVKLTRAGVFRRDHYTCLYCGRMDIELTIDHVIPRNQGGPHTWENVATACHACNRRKAGRTPEQAGMKLLQKPYRPQSTTFFIPRHYRIYLPDWEEFLPPKLFI